MKGYGRILKKLPISDWKVIAQFNRIVKNYLKMRQIKKLKAWQQKNQYQ